MIAVDTNILVYAHRAAAAAHAAAARAITALAEGDTPFALPASVLSEYLRVVTNPRFVRPASTPERAVADLDRILASPAARVLYPSSPHWDLLRRTVVELGLRGNDIFDARLVATCVQHGIDELLTEDRGFERFPQVRAVTLARFLER